jgi:hypothetical protein
LHRAAIGRNQRPPNLELNATNTFFAAIRRASSRVE